eukprot:TRINITY_DN1563_c0_g1_i1.p1 TRINITY_DN1563_c0_g1~~TRINITY_DN1563_c0_g1_i1.p1  ORF type:complete len:155 (-),score=23.71 TRINITY_DN1563_c0_g1_i1:53-517(-)
MTILQEIPINLLSSAQLAQYTEPPLPDPDVYIMMPSLKALRPVIERMKNISEFLHLTANMNGELEVSVETDMVSIATLYGNLEHPQIEGKSPPKLDAEQKVQVKISIKQFVQFLYSYQVGPTNVICCLVENRAVVLHVLLDDLYITYYLPVVLH